MRVLPGPSWETGHRSPACKQNALRQKRRSPPAFRRKGKSCRVSPRPPPTVWHELFSRVPEKRPQCLSPARTSGEPRCFQNEIAHTQMKKKKKNPVCQAALDRERFRGVACGRRLVETQIQLTGDGDGSPHLQKVVSAWPTLKSH